MTDFFSINPEAQVARLEAASQEALQHWGIDSPALGLLKYRENAVFRVDHTGGPHALRVHRFGYHSDDALGSELQWMQALDEAGIAVPKLVPADDGRLFVTQDGADLPGPLQVDLFEWIEGKQLGSIEEGLGDVTSVERDFRVVGELAAKVHNQAVAWQLPAGFKRHAWDVDGIAGEAPFWGRFWELEAADAEERRLLERGRDAVRSDLCAVPKSPGSYSMIHADFVPENIMVDSDGLRLIDFDDAGFGWHLFELVTSLYFLDESSFEVAKDALIEGYRGRRQLTDEQVALLPLFFMARGLTYVGWAHTRPETETAKELTPSLLEMGCNWVEHYFSKSS
jgi:Ser/Thr protein kinase RdoA (MazF antagonist)